MHRTMDRAEQMLSKSIWTVWTLTLFCFPIIGTDAILATAGAQKSSPEIIAKERRDPAAGDVVIINRRKAKDAAPNPYAPDSSKSEATQRPRQQAKPKSKAKLRDGDSSRTARRLASQPELTPPLPSFNKSKRPQTARLQQFPQAGLTPQQRELDEKARRASVPRRQERRPARRDDDDWRDEARERWRYDWRENRQDWRRYRRSSRRQAFRGRSWRQCRRLAWRCEDGFEGACYIWDRRCSR